MALYKYDHFLKKSSSDAFDTISEPGQVAAYAGIYRCVTCGWEIGIASGHTLPPQNHHAHPRQPQGKVRWQLTVYAVHEVQ